MKKTLSKVSFDRIVEALQTYKKTDDLNILLTETAVLAEDPNTHSLLRGFYQFVRPHHKKSFDEKCQELTGQGCGYKPEHSLSKDEKKAAILQSAEERQAAGPLSLCQLDTQQLNQGGRHLSQQGLKAAPAGSDPKNEVHTAFLADVKKALGAEKSAQLFQAIRSYKKTDNYDDLVATVASLFTEREENFNFLIRFSVFVRPHHKKNYREMLDALMGQPNSATDSLTLSEEQQRPALPSSPLKTQSKISSFFSSSERK